MVKKKGIYTEDSIESLSPLEFTRLRPGVYCGDTTYSTQLLVEIVSNAVDEFRLGHGNKINVKINKDIITVEDFGQGFIPNHKREDGKTILEAAFSVLNTSGKYRDDGTYEGTSLGSFGIGSKITTFLSNWLEVTTHRDGEYEYVKFVEGVFDKRECGKWNKENNPSGTCIKWKPSKEFFTNTKIETTKIKDLFKTITCLCPGLTINLKNNEEEVSYYSSNGLSDLLNKETKDKEILSNRCEFKYKEGKYAIDFILTYVDDYSSTLVPYVNTGLTEKGLHITAVRTIITREFNKFFRNQKWIKEKEENLTGADLSEGMYVVFNITAPNVAYDAQVKSTITKIDMSLINTAISENLELWLNSNEKDAKLIADKALGARRAREAAKKARDTARAADGKSKQKLAKLPSKLVDANSKKRSECELFICEGKCKLLP